MATWINGVVRDDDLTAHLTDADPIRLYRSFVAVVMLTRENASAKQMVDLRVCVPARYKDTFATLTVFVPNHRDSMSRILAI